MSEFPNTGAALIGDRLLCSLNKHSTHSFAFPPPPTNWRFGDKRDPILALWELTGWFGKP